MQSPARARAACHRYQFGAARISSEIVLGGLLPCDDDVGAIEVHIAFRRVGDLSFRWEPLAGQQPSDTPDWLVIRRAMSADGHWFRIRYEYRDSFADFAIRDDGLEVAVEASDDADDSHLAHIAEGAILGQAMRLAGTPLLHGNAVAADGNAVLLVGGSGAGKSSLSWALVQHGCRLLSDDLAAWTVSDSCAIAWPVRTRLRMWPRVAARLSIDASMTAPLFPSAPEMSKLGVFDPDALQTTPLPLHAIYFVRRSRDQRDDAVIAEQPADKALVLLAANLYGQIDPGKRARQHELRILSSLCATVPVRSLTLPHDLPALPRVAGVLRHSLFT